MKSFFFLILFFLLLTPESSKSQNISFQNVYGTSSDEDPVDLIKCQNGDFLLVGNTISSTQVNETELIRIDNLGAVIWSKKLSGSIMRGIAIKAGIQTLSGGFCFVGDFVDSPPQDSSYLVVIQTDANGQVLWSVQTGAPLNNPNEYAVGLSESPDSSLYICGYSFQTSTVFNPFVTKISAGGNVKWSKLINFASEKPIGIISPSATKEIIGINDMSAGNFVLIELDSAGSFTKASSFTESNSLSIELADFILKPNGQSITCIINNPFTSNPDGTTYYDIDTTLNSISTGGYGSYDAFEATDTISGINVIYNSWGEILFLASATSTYASAVLIDPITPTFTYSIFLDTLFKSFPCKVQSGPNGSEMVLTKKMSATNIPEDFILTRTFNTSNFHSSPDSACFGKTPIGVFSVAIYLNIISQIIAINNYLDSTSILSPVIQSASVTIPLTSNCLVVNLEEEISAHETFSIFPNPSNYEFYLTGNFSANTQLHIYDLLGQEIMEPFELSEGNQTIPIELNIAEGIYFYRIVSYKEILHSDRLVIVR